MLRYYLVAFRFGRFSFPRPVANWSCSPRKRQTRQEIFESLAEKLHAWETCSKKQSNRRSRLSLRKHQKPWKPPGSPRLVCPLGHLTFRPVQQTRQRLVNQRVLGVKTSGKGERPGLGKGKNCPQDICVLGHTGFLLIPKSISTNPWSGLLHG